MNERPPEADRPAAPATSTSSGGLARWTPVGLLVLTVLFFVGYIDLKTQLERIESSGALDAEPGEPVEAVPSPGSAHSPPQHDPLQPPPSADPQAGAAWSCTGSLTREQVAEVIGQHGRSVFQCHEARAAQVPDLSGTLNMHLRVDPAGGVDQVRFTGPLQDPELLECVRNALPEWRFPAPAGGDCAVVHAPFSLGG